ncbi:MAG TPA: MFS transporter [Candidatus Binatia bacterium]|nr:MFS transporter [Candidatus Binatia bacterium]
MTKTDREIRRVKWVFGTTYAVQGSSALADIPTLYFIKFILELDEAGGQLFQTLKSLGWLVKPLWGFISDRFPLFGYRRKSWFILMALLALVFWAANALCAFLHIRIPLVYLVGFNLAFSTYAFVDVVGDALMVEHGRKLKRVGSFVNFQWTMLALSNAAVAIISGWFQEQIEAGRFEYWMIFLLTGIPPLFTAVVGFINIDESPVSSDWKQKRKQSSEPQPDPVITRITRFMPNPCRSLRNENEVMVLLVLFIIFWNLSPSIGYIERSYLIDFRDFSPFSFGIIFTAQAITFLVSILTYRFIVTHWPGIQWYHYLYGVVALMVLLGFPLSFYLYLDPDHPWWDYVDITLPATLNPLPEWNRYQWFRLITQTVLGFASIPAFLIPLTIAGETVKLEYAGVGYAFLMSLSNVTNMFEGVVGAALYDLFSRPWLAWLVEAFQGSALDIAGTADERTLILEIFVYISLLFTLLTIPFLLMLKRELERRKIAIHLGRPEP